MKRAPVLHPFLFAIFPFVFLFSYNITELSILERSSILNLIIPIGVTLCFTLLSWVLLTILFKGQQKAGILASIFLLIFFSCGHFKEIYSNTIVTRFGRTALFKIGSFQFDQYEVYCSLSFVLFVLVIYFIRKTRKSLVTCTHVLNIVAAALIIISLTKIGLYEVKRSALLNHLSDNWDTGSLATNSADKKSADAVPDIYYIILDMYAAASTLEESFHYNNQEFLDYLTNKGFYVASKSRSNYTCTVASLASSLNLGYLNGLTDIIGRQSQDLMVLIRMVENSTVMRFLKSKGYTFIHFRSGFQPTKHNRYADWDIDCGTWLNKDAFRILLIEMTILYPFLRRYELDSFRDRLLCTFSRLAELDGIEGPLFVFAHIMAPHWPYVLGPNGEFVTDRDREIFGEKTLYVNQVMGVNHKVKELVDEIMSKSEQPPIIILQADHGSRPDPWEEHIKEWVRILNAYHLPRGGNALLYDSITPVNTFRGIFNFYFGTDYELLDDQSYYVPYDAPYQFINVTDRAKYE